MFYNGIGVTKNLLSAKKMFVRYSDMLYEKYVGHRYKEEIRCSGIAYIIPNSKFFFETMATCIQNDILFEYTNFPIKNEVLICDERELKQISNDYSSMKIFTTQINSKNSLFSDEIIQLANSKNLDGDIAVWYELQRQVNEINLKEASIKYENGLKYPSIHCYEAYNSGKKILRMLGSSRYKCCLSPSLGDQCRFLFRGTDDQKIIILKGFEDLEKIFNKEVLTVSIQEMQAVSVYNCLRSFENINIEFFSRRPIYPDYYNDMSFLKMKPGPTNEGNWFEKTSGFLDDVPFYPITNRKESADKDYSNAVLLIPHSDYMSKDKGYLNATRLIFEKITHKLMIEGVKIYTSCINKCEIIDGTEQYLASISDFANQSVHFKKIVSTYTGDINLLCLCNCNLSVIVPRGFSRKKIATTNRSCNYNEYELNSEKEVEKIADLIVKSLVNVEK
jgi:hypothetical protein